MRLIFKTKKNIQVHKKLATQITRTDTTFQITAFNNIRVHIGIKKNDVRFLVVGKINRFKPKRLGYRKYFELLVKKFTTKLI